MKINKHLIVFIGTILLITACTVPVVVKNPDGSSSTNIVVDPKLTAGLATAGAVNTVTAPVNPFSPAIEIGLSAAGLLAAWIAKRKNDKANQQALLLKTVIQGVENSGSTEAKAAIQAHAATIGVEGELGTTVQGVNSGLL